MLGRMQVNFNPPEVLCFLFLNLATSALPLEPISRNFYRKFSVLTLVNEKYKLLKKKLYDREVTPMKLFPAKAPFAFYQKPNFALAGDTSSKQGLKSTLSGA